MKLKLFAILILVCTLLCACGAKPESPELPMDLPENVGEIIVETTEPVATDAPAEETAPVEETTAPVETEPEETEPVETKPVETKPVATEPVATEPVKTEPVVTEPPAKNEFINYNNNIYEEGVVSIRPRYVYWEGDTLVAQCFVINGTSTPLQAVRVDGLSFRNAAGVIADARFDILNGVTLDPYSHVIWTFRFNADTVYQAGGDLSSLYCYYDVAYLN